MIDIDEPETLNLYASLHEAQLIIEALRFWASDHDGVASVQNLALARKAAMDIETSLSDDEVAALDARHEPEAETSVPGVMISGFNESELGAVADTLRENAEYGTEFDGVLRRVADQLEGKTEERTDD